MGSERVPTEMGERVRFNTGGEFDKVFVTHERGLTNSVKHRINNLLIITHANLLFRRHFIIYIILKFPKKRRCSVLNYFHSLYNEN